MTDWAEEKARKLYSAPQGITYNIVNGYHDVAVRDLAAAFRQCAKTHEIQGYARGIEEAAPDAKKVESIVGRHLYQYWPHAEPGSRNLVARDIALEVCAIKPKDPT